MHLTSTYRRVSILWICFGWSFTFARGEEIISPKLNIHIDLNDVKLDANKSEGKSLLKQACRLLSEGLKAQSGDYKQGFFTSIGCFTKSKDDPGAWWLIVRRESTRIVFNIYYQDQLEASASFVSSDRDGELLTDVDFMTLVAASLMDQMPAKWRFENLRGEISMALEEEQEAENQRWKIPTPSETLLLYGLEREGPYFLTTPMGKLRRRDTNEGKLWQGKIKGIRRVVWAHNLEGRGARCQELQQQIDAASKQVLGEMVVKKITGILPGSYVGVRYGKGITNDPLMKRLSLLSVFTELRSGRLSGLNYNYDKISKVRYTNDQDLDLEFSLRSHSVGFSISIPFGESAFRMEVRPKVGLLSMNAALEKDNEVFYFNLPLSNSFGGVLAFEMKQYIFTSRLWANYEYAIGVLRDETNSEGTVESYLYGLNVYVDGPKIAHSLQMAFVLFAFDSANRLRSKAISETGETISYNQGFGGIGLSLTW